MIYRGRCDRFMCFRQPSERWRHVHQGYWALSSFTLEERERRHTHSQSILHKISPYNLNGIFELVFIWFWRQLINLKELYWELLYFSSSPVISRGADELRDLPWQQLDCPLWVGSHNPFLPLVSDPSALTGNGRHLRLRKPNLSQLSLWFTVLRKNTN